MKQCYKRVEIKKEESSRKTLQVSGDWSSNNDPKEVCLLRRKRKKIVNRNRKEDKVPDVDRRGKGSGWI